jgi:mRNA interferase RelE/StbE
VGCEKLAGHDKYRIRQGNYRVLYTIEDDVLIVTVIAIGNRRDIYRR